MHTPRPLRLTAPTNRLRFREPPTAPRAFVGWGSPARPTIHHNRIKPPAQQPAPSLARPRPNPPTIRANHPTRPGEGGGEGSAQHLPRPTRPAVACLVAIPRAP